jgi:hypothetical protein
MCEYGKKEEKIKEWFLNCCCFLFFFVIIVLENQSLKITKNLKNRMLS